MTGLVIFLFSVIVASALAGIAATHDWRGLKIPNMYAVGIAGLFGFCYSVLSLMDQPNTFFMAIQSHLLSFFIVFIVTFIMYSLRLLGAGDSKLAAAMALWVATPGLPAFLFYTTCAGGILAVCALSLRKVKHVPAVLNNGWVTQLRDGKSDLPYGLALACGFVATLVYRGAFSSATLLSFLNP